MNPEVKAYNEEQEEEDQKICNVLAATIAQELSDADNRIWHGHPVWFLEENPIVGYSKQKKGIRLMFWSGADFNEADLNVRGEKFKDASVFYTSVAEVETNKLAHWLEKARAIQWDYKNIVKRKGKLERLK